MRFVRERAADYEYEVLVNGSSRYRGTFDETNALGHTLIITAADLRPGNNEIRVVRNGDGPLYVRLIGTIYRDVDNMDAAGEIGVVREYLNAETGKPLGADSHAKVGDLVRVKVSVHNPDESWYVIVEDHLPTGLEGLNERLATTSYVAREYEDEEFGWQKNGYNRKDVLDDRVAFFITQLMSGNHTYSYLVRVTHAGTFYAPPARLWILTISNKFTASAVRFLCYNLSKELTNHQSLAFVVVHCASPPSYAPLALLTWALLLPHIHPKWRPRAGIVTIPRPRSRPKNTEGGDEKGSLTVSEGNTSIDQIPFGCSVGRKIRKENEMTDQRKLRHILVVGILLAVLITSAPLLVAAKGQMSDGPSVDPNTQFYVAKPNHGAIEQFADLTSSGEKADARLIRELIEIPQAVWFSGDAPKGVQQAVKNTVQRAAGKGTVPVLVAYNIPFRDCAQFSAGGATTVQEYTDWIDGFAAGIGDRKALVILEPDGLGIIPWYKQFRGLPSEGGYEWCQPAEADEATAADERFEMLNYAVDALKAKPNVAVYLDGTHSSWLGSGDAAHRLVQAGVERADGFFLNVSNYRFTEHLEKYGTWISKCLWFSTDPGSWGNGNFDWCASQYYPADPNDFSTWSLTDQWYTDNVESQTWVPYPGDEGLTGFVIDTSRNGQGHWTPTASYPDPQDWCNPPGRGLGLQPTADTGNTLIDAYLWIKIPGESDGECTRGLGPAGETVDPEWGLIDPPAGEWFPDMALDLAHNANPPLD